jgi:hypothetical protein
MKEREEGMGMGMMFGWTSDAEVMPGAKRNGYPHLM